MDDEEAHRMTNIVELDPEKMRSIEWHGRVQITSEWLWQMRKAGRLPAEVADAFNHLLKENGYDISEMVGCEGLTGPDAIPLD
jgi:hypothetical protein